MDYRGLCMGVLWKVCFAFRRPPFAEGMWDPNLGSGRNSEQRMLGMLYSVRSNTGLLVWIQAFYIFSLSVLKEDQFRIDSYFSIHLRQLIMVSHPEGLRIREENVQMRECSLPSFWREALRGIDRNHRARKLSSNTLQHVLQSAESACFFAS